MPQTQRQDEVRGKSPQNHNPKFICTRCGKGYYSATSLDRLHDPYCSDPDCRGELARYEKFVNEKVSFGRGS